MPAAAREIVETATDPRPDLLLGYWDEILHRSDEALAAERRRELTSIGDRGITYRWVTSAEPPARYAEWLTAACRRSW